MPAGAQEPSGYESYRSYASYRACPGTITRRLRLRRQRGKLVLRKQRPRAFAFLAHDRCPAFRRGIKGVRIHELAIGIIESEVDCVGGFIERAITDDFRGASTK